MWFGGWGYQYFFAYWVMFVPIMNLAEYDVFPMWEVVMGDYI
jgi:hypothetical protein